MTGGLPDEGRLDDVVSGQVNSYVIEIKWVGPAGKLRDASLTRNPGLLYFVRSSYGLCGVIYEVTFRGRTAGADSIHLHSPSSEGSHREGCFQDY